MNKIAGNTIAVILFAAQQTTMQNNKRQTTSLILVKNGERFILYVRIFIFQANVVDSNN